MENGEPLLIIFGGLPGTGKTTLARELARQLGAQHLRIDSIEQAIRDCASDIAALNEAGYRVAYAIARDNLNLGRTVIADSVNPLPVTRDAWCDVGCRAQARTIEVEVRCSDAREHRCRVESRSPDIPGLQLPTWDEVVCREYQPCVGKHIVIDTARRSVDQSLKFLRDALSDQLSRCV